MRKSCKHSPSCGAMLQCTDADGNQTSGRVPDDRSFSAAAGGAGSFQFDGPAP